MTHLRLFIYEGSEVLDRSYSRFPVRIGRHPRNECQLVDSHISRFHAQIELESGALVVRDVGSENGTLIMEGASGRMLRGTGSRSSDGQLALLLGHVRVLARIEEGEREELPDAFAPAAREAAQALLDACAPYATRVYAGAAGPETLHPVIDALFRNLLRLDSALQADNLDPVEGGTVHARRSETASALLNWTHASSVALRLLAHASERWCADEGALPAHVQSGPPAPASERRLRGAELSATGSDTGDRTPSSENGS
jgi:predicted component of type VI protein secretion system